MKYIFLLSFLLGITGMKILAQETIPASGGDASGNEGSVSYSVGQVVYCTNTGRIGSITQGVQQGYKIYTTTGINETDIKLSASVYPNPTTNYLQLSIETIHESFLRYQLFDMQGKLLKNQKVIGNETQIDMGNFVPSTYLLKIMNHNQSIKEFKIIKQ